MDLYHFRPEPTGSVQRTRAFQDASTGAVCGNTELKDARGLRRHQTIRQNKQKAEEAPADATTQALQVVHGAALAPLFGAAVAASPRSADPAPNAPRIVITQDAPPLELSRTLLGTLQQMITSAICEQLTTVAPTLATRQPEVIVLGQAELTVVMPKPEASPGLAQQPPAQAGDVPPQWLARLESLQKELQDVQLKVFYNSRYLP
ncbi:UNVERIFIED_CONTAM: hypothetical protein Sradi_0196900 [Sesamum radiatum]|uniref:Uncharacterized protein n=1 Tax=Sesamum radiatum TaxID=300843 RepID=A0AAW2VZB0_SESRA